MKNDLTPQALQGFAVCLDAVAAQRSCPYLHSGPAAMAWTVGAWLRRTGRPAPRVVRMSRGYRVRVDDLIVDAEDPLAIEPLTPAPAPGLDNL
ncbi:MAG: hypothetical protein ACK5TK_04515 [Betaproteobacteria bacterium]